MGFLAIFSSVFLSSIISGIFGIAGGMLLMASLILLLPISSTMILHGFVQAAANCSRAFYLRSELHPRLILNYFWDSCLAMIFFIFVTIIPDKATILLLLGSFPLLVKLFSRFKVLDITDDKASITAGVLMTGLQLVAGVSGPVLDAFYVYSKLSRLEVVANKAFSQTLGHIFKIIYYSIFVDMGEQLPDWLIVAATITAVCGTRLGTNALKKRERHCLQTIQ